MSLSALLLTVLRAGGSVESVASAQLLSASAPPVLVSMMKISCASQPCLALSREPTSPPSLQDSLKPHPPTTRRYFIPIPLFCERQIRFVNLKLKLSVDPSNLNLKE